MSAIDLYSFYETVYDYVQSEHDRLTGLGSVGFVSAFIDDAAMFTVITEDIADARATIEALASPGNSFYVIGADIRDI